MIFRRALTTVFLLAACPALGAAPEVSFEVSPGWRTEDFHWNIAGDLTGGNPNVLSELTWSGVKVQEVRLSAALRRPGVYFVGGSWAGGAIFKGRNQDSDYAGDNRTFEFSRSNNDARQGDTRDVRLEAGFPVGDLSGGEVAPCFGWVYAAERLFMTNGNQTVSTVPSFLGPFSGLNSHFRHRWQGFWWGVKAEARRPGGWTLRGALRYAPSLDYLAHADWNLRSDLMHPKSYEHTADGKGWDLEAAVSKAVSPAADVGVELAWRRWRAGPGLDRTFNSDGTNSVTRMNEALWKIFSVRIAVSFLPSRPDEYND